MLKIYQKNANEYEVFVNQCMKNDLLRMQRKILLLNVLCLHGLESSLFILWQLFRFIFLSW